MVNVFDIARPVPKQRAAKRKGGGNNMFARLGKAYKDMELLADEIARLRAKNKVLETTVARLQELLDAKMD